MQRFFRLVRAMLGWMLLFSANVTRATASDSFSYHWAQTLSGAGDQQANSAQ